MQMVQPVPKCESTHSAKQDVTPLCVGRYFNVVSAIYPQRSNLQGIRRQIPFWSSLCGSLVSRVTERSCLHGCGYLRKAKKKNQLKGKWCTKGKFFSNPTCSFYFMTITWYCKIIKIQTVWMMPMASPPWLPSDPQTQASRALISVTILSKFILRIYTHA